MNTITLFDRIMKRLQRLLRGPGYLFLLLVFLGCFLITSPVRAQSADEPITDTTDLSQMDWSDEPEDTAQEESAPITDSTDLSNMDWSDTPEDAAGSNQMTEDFSDMSWEDDETDKPAAEGFDLSREMTKSEVAELAGQERRVHIYGFFTFIGYIIGGILTAFFTRNRKLAIDYPPELLIVLHTFWPVEWLFILFAGKKVR